MQNIFRMIANPYAKWNQLALLDISSGRPENRRGCSNKHKRISIISSCHKILFDRKKKSEENQSLIGISHVSFRVYRLLKMRISTRIERNQVLISREDFPQFYRAQIIIWIIYIFICVSFSCSLGRDMCLISSSFWCDMVSLWWLLRCMYVNWHLHFDLLSFV